MVGALLAIALGVLLYAIASQGDTTDPRIRRLVVGILMSGYALRLVLQAFIRDIPFFSHGIGGDNIYYEEWARTVLAIWEHSGIEWIGQDQFPEIGETSLPANLFAFVFWLNGGPTRIGCTAVVALSACLTCYNLYRLAIEYGADEGFAARILTLLLFGPAFLMYTSEMYKDGLVSFFVVGAVGSAFRLSRKFSLLHAAIGLASLVPLWYVRYYLVFVTVGPLLVGLTGLNAKSALRPLLAVLFLAAVAILLASYTQALDQVTERFNTTFEIGTSRAVRESNGQHGLRVEFDDGGNPFGALPLKLTYTVLAPFFWQPGSIGFQIGKLDAFIWYYLLYQAFKAGRVLFRTDKLRLIMFLVFLLPTTLMYALSMANIGLTVRQRLPIVLFTGMLAALSRRRVIAEAGNEVEDRSGEALAAAPAE